MCGLTALLISPVSWVPHWVWAVPLLIMLGALAWRHRSAWWLAVAVVTAAVFGLRLIFWILPVDAFYPMSNPANLGTWHQLVSVSYAILAVALLPVLAYPVLRRRTPVAATPGGDSIATESFAGS